MNLRCFARSSLGPGLAAAGMALGAAAALADGDAVQLQASTIEPRAYGYQVGAVLRREVLVQVPPGLSLDEASLPRAGVHARLIELRALTRSAGQADGVRQERITLDYQVFLAPTAVRTLELPPLVLRYQGEPRAQELRVDAWPITVAPLVPPEVSPRRGLGEIQPDDEPPLIDTSSQRLRLLSYGAAAGLLLAYLALVYWGLPWSRARHRPFAAAWREMRKLPDGADATAWRAACLRLHQALNAAAGEAVFEHGLERFISRHQAFAELRADLLEFLRQSRREFFSVGTSPAPADIDMHALKRLCRRCRDAERGT